ncbi:MAG: hypothetical protein B0W54_10935 [Cellvibrio sp. 79]|nr:MAG: hypothetical protein B0W54_10935 [Cellvibrio sp. 79]
MAKVKGSPVYRLQVVPHRPLKSALIGGAFALLVVAALIATYKYAENKASNERLTIQEAQELREQLAKATAEITDLRREQTKYQVSAEVDRQAGEDIRKKVLDLREENAALQRDIDVLRIMTSDKNKNPKGISFGVFSVDSLPDNKHQLKLVVQKLAEGDDEFTGQLRFMVVGQRDGQEVKISLHELAVTKVDSTPLSESIPLSFKFFQNIETEIVLPEGFTPIRVELSVKPDSSRNSAVVEGQLEWPEIK